MRYLFRYIILFIICWGAFNSCELETDWDIKSTEKIIIVDALITNENKTQTIKIYYSNDTLNEDSEPVSGASITITDGSNNYSFSESPTEPGLYLSAPFTVATNITYTLLIEYEGQNDTAVASMFPISPLKNYLFEQKDGLGKYIYTGSDLPSMTEIYYDWSAIPEYCAQYGSCMAAETYYSLDIIDIGQEFAPAKQEILFPLGTTIIRKKYSLSEEHQEFVRSLLIETEWRGGLFDTEHGNIPTNFRNGTRGWFGVCQVLSDSINIAF